ncbi:MAG: DDE-type integrase/transposase/recombinase [Opitutaceae bacterium]|nr:DDE-type integrase/transposase/recombinase [Opitutaceae bacterium]
MNTDDGQADLEVGWILEDSERAKGHLIRVLWCDPEWVEPGEAWVGGQSHVVVIDIIDERAWPEIVPMRQALGFLKSRRWTRSNNPDPFPYAYRCADQIGDESRRERYRQLRKKTAGFVHAVSDQRPMCFVDTVRSQLVSEAAKAHKVSEGAIRKWLRLFWRAGEDDNALWPRRRFCGAPTIAEVFEKQDALPKRRGRPPLDADLTLKNGEEDFAVTSKSTQALLRKGFEEFLRENQGNGNLVTRRKGFPWDGALQDIVIKYFKARTVMQPNRRGVLVATAIKVREELLPTINHLKAAVKVDEKLSKIVKRLLGEKRFNLRNRTKPGDPRKLALGPGTLFQIDWMLADVFLVSRLNRLPCGRPYVYFIVDHFSRMIVGLYVTFDHPDYATACKALLNAFSDKVAYAARFGVTIKKEDWPAEHVCWRLLADNGELAGFESDNIVQFELSDIANTPPYRGDLKGLVESSFRCANIGTIRWLRGSTRGPRERCAPDPRLQATLTIHEFTALLIDWVINWYNVRVIENYPYTELMVRKQVATVPITLWKWGRRNTGRARRVPYDELRMRLATFGEARIKETGLWFGGLCYFRDEGWFRELMFRGGPSGKPVRVSYDPDDSHSVFLWPDGPDGQPTEIMISEVSRQYDRTPFGEVAMALEDKGTLNRIARREAKERKRGHRLFAKQGVAKAVEDTERKHGSLPQRAEVAKVIDPKEERAKEAALNRNDNRPLTDQAPPSAPPPSKPNTSLNLLSRFKRKDKTQSEAAS